MNSILVFVSNLVDGVDKEKHDLRAMLDIRYKHIYFVKQVSCYLSVFSLNIIQ